MTENKPLELKQKYLDQSRYYFLEPDRVRVIYKSLNGKNESFFDYESISTRTKSVTIQKGRVLIMAVVFGLFTLLGLFFGFIINDPVLISISIIAGIISLIYFGLFFYQRRRYFVVDLYNNNFQKNKSIFFIAGKPSPEQLASFIKSLFEARRNFLRDKYFVVDSDEEPARQLIRFKWLLNEELISEDEFQEMKQLLKSKDSPLGFV